jgi:uncharacterized protein YlaN (UPF0358 family)
MALEAIQSLKTTKTIKIIMQQNTYRAYISYEYLKMNGMYDISIKIDFSLFPGQEITEQEEKQFVKDLEEKFKQNIQDFMNQLKAGNGKVYHFRITKQIG